jgi:hypothetical protein
VSFDGGGLGASLQDPIQLKPDGHVNDKGGLKMNFRFTLATGIFNGSVTPPGAKRAVTFQGVALQKQNLGSGFFKNANQAGRVLIQQ